MSEPILWLHINWLISLINANKLVLDELVVWHVLIFKLVDIVEDLFHFLDVLGLVP